MFNLLRPRPFLSSAELQREANLNGARMALEDMPPSDRMILAREIVSSKDTPPDDMRDLSRYADRLADERERE